MCGKRLEGYKKNMINWGIRTMELWDFVVVVMFIQLVEIRRGKYSDVLVFSYMPRYLILSSACLQIDSSFLNTSFLMFLF